MAAILPSRIIREQLKTNMGNNEIGEHSRKTRNDNNKEEERPFKKAKYVWQLKGKYHLKDSHKQSTTSDTKQGPSREPKEAVKVDEVTISTTNTNNNNNNVKNKCCNKCCLDTLLARSNALLDSEDSSDLDISSNNIDRSIYDEIPVTLVKPNQQNPDDFLNKWQARQVAKCYVDNTINSILEQWKLAPVDVGDFVENCDNDGHVEDEGILMAIQSHGLQTGLNQSASKSYDTQENFVSEGHSLAAESDNYENICYESRRNEEEEMETDMEKNNSYEVADETDFLSAAVSVAIQKKGLASYTCG